MAMEPHVQAAFDQVLAGVRDFLVPLMQGIAQELERGGIPEEHAWWLAREIAIAQWRHAMDQG